MYAVIFEAVPAGKGREEYLAIAAKMREFIADQKGFLSIERFQSLVDEKRMLSLSFWETEPDIESWRNQFDHRKAQKAGKERLFESYRIRVAEVVRDYTNTDRQEAPADSVEYLG